MKKSKKLIILLLILITPLLLSACEGSQLAMNSDGTSGYSYRSANIKTHHNRILNKKRIKHTFRTMESSGDNNIKDLSDTGEPANVINSAKLNNYINSISNIQDYREHIKVVNNIHYGYIYLTLTRKS